VIDLDDVVVDFGAVEVLDGVELTVEAGEFVALVGPNGAGKTTLLRTVNGVLAPDGGSVTLDGDPVTDLSSRAVSRRVATVPQDTHVGFDFSAEAIVEMGRTPHRSRLDWGTDTEPVAAAMERTETSHLADRSVDDLSGGERQRVLVARALAQDAPALLLDEPTASLDINHQVRVLDLARDLAADGHAVLAAIHDLDLAARFCDRMALLHDGGIRAAGRPTAVLASSDLGDAFETKPALHSHPVTGTPMVAAIDRTKARDATVHIAGSGAVTARVLGICWEAGFDVSIGVVPAGDVAASAAESLGAPAVTAPPFDQPAAATVDEATSHLSEADVCLRVDGGPVPVGGDLATPVVDFGAEEPESLARRDVIDAVLDGLERRQVPADD
jgi:iron complex transport system ATP-binding protein